MSGLESWLNHDIHLRQTIQVCPMLPEQRLEYAACEEAVRAATPTGKPSPEMLQVFEVR